jgi:hypothetical protein
MILRKSDISKSAMALAIGEIRYFTAHLHENMV